MIVPSSGEAQVWLTNNHDIHKSRPQIEAFRAVQKLSKDHLSIWTKLFSYAHHEIHERHERDKPLRGGSLCVLLGSVSGCVFAVKL